MRLQNFTTALMGLMVVSVLCGDLQAQRRMGIPFGKTKTQHTPESLELTQKAGPWLIMCASFSGDDGKLQATRLAKEFRESHKVKAYIYSHSFDFAREVQHRGLGWEKVGEKVADGVVTRPRRMKPAGESQVDEFAVVVGDFASIKDARAQRALQQIKVFAPKSMVNYDIEAALKDESLAGNRLRAWRDFASSASATPDRNSVGASKTGPLRAAFMMPNPLLPDEYFSARKLDDDVVSWNVKLKHSLLHCPGAYSIRIATFSGETILRADEIRQKEQENDWLRKNKKTRTDSKIERAFKRAHVLTEVLRKKGIEAYEFHDRFESYVCVGSYDWLAREGASGRKESNPEMVTMIKKFKGKVVNAGGRQAMQTYKLPDNLVKARIACDVQPVPVLNPKASQTQLASKKRGLGLFRLP